MPLDEATQVIVQNKPKVNRQAQKLATSLGAQPLLSAINILPLIYDYHRKRPASPYSKESSVQERINCPDSGLPKHNYFKDFHTRQPRRIVDDDCRL
jgi:hypothetical protein